MNTKFPGEMTAQEFFALPVSDGLQAGLQDLRSRNHPTGFQDPDGHWWRWILRGDGTYARERI